MPLLEFRGPWTVSMIRRHGTALWTLFWEVVCYVLVGVVLRFLRPQLARVALLVPFVLGSA